MSRAVKKAETREKILAAARKLFSLKSISSVSTQEIATEAGIAKGSVFHHFDNKEALSIEVMKSFMDELMVGFKEMNTALDDDINLFDPMFESFLNQIFVIEANNPNMTRLFVHYLAEYPLDFSNEHSVFSIIMTELMGYMESFYSMFRKIGISRPEERAMIFFSSIDGLIFQYELFPNLFTPEFITSLVSELMSLLKFWRLH